MIKFLNYKRHIKNPSQIYQTLTFWKHLSSNNLVTNWTLSNYIDDTVKVRFFLPSLGTCLLCQTNFQLILSYVKNVNNNDMICELNSQELYKWWQYTDHSVNIYTLYKWHKYWYIERKPWIQEQNVGIITISQIVPQLSSTLCTIWVIS